jgi:diguanylate cyclase (GGDEF)-like protein
MNIRQISINLSKNMNRFIFLNILMLIATWTIFLYFSEYKQKEVLAGILLAGLGLIISNFTIAKTLKRKMEKIIKHSLDQVENQLYFDELTSVYNRKTGMNRLNEEIARAGRIGKPTCVAILDIDNFKTINDTYGHLVGDRVLRHVALQIKNSLRTCDIVARYGGEEFLIILPDTDEINAIMALDRVKMNIAKKPIRVGREYLNITVSIGVTEISNNEHTLSSIDKADKALYKAKKNGKNKIEVFLNYAHNKN